MGYDAAFLGGELTVPVPEVVPELAADLVQVAGSPVLDYTHFSLVMSSSRRLARWVAWNIDGAAFEFADAISRDGVDFRPDPRVPVAAQTLDDVYADNSLDRGHLARRSDLLWGPLEEATAANEDSFFFTNIAPQRSSFNQSQAAGVWGELENALLDSAKADRQRVCVQAGPVLAGDDPAYRDTLLPRSFFKAVAYATEGTLAVRAFLLTQDLEGLDDPARVTLDDFAVYQVDLETVTAQASLVFDPALVAAQVQSDAAPRPGAPVLLEQVGDVQW